MASIKPDQTKMSKKYSAMKQIDNANFSSIYTSEIYFDDWAPCVTCPWSRIYNNKSKTLQPEWQHLNSKEGTHFLFQIPEKGIHGLLFIDNGKTYFRDHYKSRLSQLRIRNSLKGMNILGAFWIPHKQLLIIHDIYMYNSQSICEEVFTNRWKKLEEATTFIEADDVYQGFTLRTAEALNEDAGDLQTSGATNEESATVIFQPNSGLATVIHSIPVGVAKVTVKTQTVSSPTVKEIKADDKIEGEVYISKHSKFNGPESFQLWSIKENVDLGMPCIQSLKLIQAVRNALKSEDKIRVNVIWNKNLNSYEVMSIKE
jgi:hypothetical protein